MNKNELTLMGGIISVALVTVFTYNHSRSLARHVERVTKIEHSMFSVVGENIGTTENRLNIMEAEIEALKAQIAEAK